MKDALVTFNSQIHRVDLATYLRLKESNPEVLDRKPACPDCGANVHPWDVKGAKGFRVVADEVGRRGKKARPIPGFHHYKNDPAAAGCPLYLAHDPRFYGIHSVNEFSVMEKERNIEALSRKGMRQAINDMQAFFIQRLTKRPDITPEMRQTLDGFEKNLITMAGLSAHPWVMGYMPPVLLGAVERPPSKDSQVRRVEFVSKGWQDLPFTGLDNKPKTLIVPKKIVICWSRADGKEPNPLRNPVTLDPVTFEVSQQAAHDIAENERQNRRRRGPEQFKLNLELV